jgi:hypothetical protein
MKVLETQPITTLGSRLPNRIKDNVHGPLRVTEYGVTFVHGGVSMLLPWPNVAFLKYEDDKKRLQRKGKTEEELST